MNLLSTMNVVVLQCVHTSVVYNRVGVEAILIITESFLTDCINVASKESFACPCYIFCKHLGAIQVAGYIRLW
jgi:hypothetical protein